MNSHSSCTAVAIACLIGFRYAMGALHAHEGMASAQLADSVMPNQTRTMKFSLSGLHTLFSQRVWVIYVHVTKAAGDVLMSGMPNQTAAAIAYTLP